MYTKKAVEIGCKAEMKQECFGITNSDLVDIDKSSHSSPKTEVTDITSRYYKKMQGQNNDFSYDLARDRMLAKTPKIHKSKNKLARNNSRLLTSGVSRLNTENRTLKRNATKKKLKKKLAGISKSPKPSRKINIENYMICKSPKLAKSSNDYSCLHERKTQNKGSRVVKYNVNGHRIGNTKNTHSKN